MPAPKSASEWADVLSTPPHLRPFFTDEEIVKFSEVNLPSLLRLQTMGTISATKVPKKNGGVQRIWAMDDIFISAIAFDIHNYIGWKFEAVSKFFQLLGREYTSSIIKTSDLGETPPQALYGKGKVVPTSATDDWTVEIYNGTIIAVSNPSNRIWEQTHKLMHAFGKTRRFVGSINNSGEISWINHVEADYISGQMQSKSVINISISVRRALMRIRQSSYLTICRIEDIPSYEIADKFEPPPTPEA